MNIVWLYLDKKMATINALKDYSNMEYIIEHTDEDIAAIHEKIESPVGTFPTGMPKACNTKALEDRLVSEIDEIDVLKERYRQALEYMKWFKPAWESLGVDDKYILKVFFENEGSKTEAVANIGEKLFLERAQVYRRKEKALNQLALLLYGK